MSLKSQNSYTVPQDTASVAQAIFPNGHPYLQMYETFGTIFQDNDFVDLFPRDGQPAEAPFRLMLVLILQFLENLTDRQAADAVRACIDWKYLLCLELTDTGFHYSVLSEFRTRFLKGKAEQRSFEKVLACFREKGFLKGQRQQRTDSTHILGVIRAINRLELVGETIRQTLNTLATVAPEWMRTHSQSDWIDRYRDRIEDARLPKNETKRIALAEEMGSDGLVLFNSLFEGDAPAWLRTLPAIRTLWQVWIQNYTWQDERLRWRSVDEIPPSALMISTPYDEETHYSKKRSTSWVGYKVHLTETCTDDAPHVITHVETTSATTPDSELTLDIQTALQAKNFLPQEHLVDLGYIDAGILAASQDEFGIDLIGPAKGDYRWQARADEGFAAENFQVDWQQQLAICPANKTSSGWTQALDARKLEVIKIKVLPERLCPLSISSQMHSCEEISRRTITLRSQRQFLAQQAAREREKTVDFKQQYARRAGVEGTISQGIRSFDLRRTRYIGLGKTRDDAPVTFYKTSPADISLTISCRGSPTVSKVGKTLKISTNQELK